MTKSDDLVKPEEGTEAELHWLRGYEAGIKTMRVEKPTNMLCDLQQRHLNAVRNRDEPLRQNLFEAIEWFVWAFPDVEEEHKRRFDQSE